MLTDHLARGYVLHTEHSYSHLWALSYIIIHTLLARTVYCITVDSLYSISHICTVEAECSHLLSRYHSWHQGLYEVALDAPETGSYRVNEGAKLKSTILQGCRLW